MDTRSNFPANEAIDARLQGVVQNLAELPPWHAAWKRLTPDASDEDRLAVFRSIRDDGCLPSDAGSYLVVYQTDFVVSLDAESALADLEDRLTAIQKTHGLAEDQVWPPGEGPPEYEAARKTYEDAYDQLFFERLHADGEHDLAKLFRTDWSEFKREQEVGRQFFFGKRPINVDEIDVWLDALMDDVGACIIANDVMGPLGCRYGFEDDQDDFAHVVIYPTSTELVGGAAHGEIVGPDFSVDLEQLRTIFDQFGDFGWQAIGEHDPDGPHIWVEGIYRGREVYLRILARAPKDEEPGTKFDVSNRIWR